MNIEFIFRRADGIKVNWKDSLTGTGGQYYVHHKNTNSLIISCLVMTDGGQ